MRNVVLLGSVVFLALMVFVPASTSAASSADLVATTGIPARLYGALEAQADQGILVLRGADATPSLDLTHGGLQARIVRVTSSYVALAGAEATGDRRVVEEPATLAAGRLVLAGPRPDLLVAAIGSDAALHSQRSYASSLPDDLWSGANARLGVSIGDEELAPALPALRLGQLESGTPVSIALSKGTYGIDATGRAGLGDADQILVYGADLVQSGTQDRLTTFRTLSEEPGSAFVAATGQWVGPGTHVEETLQYIVLEPASASLELRGQVALHAPDMDLLHQGYLGLPWAEGTLRTADASHALAGDQAILGGSLRLRPIGFDVVGAPQITILGDGEVEFLQIGLGEDRIANAEAAAVAGGAAAGLGLVAALVYFWPTVKYGASLALFPLYARVPKENTLDHKGRELLYDLIKNEPGVSTNKLAKEVPFGWSTLTYHLRVLERNEAIVSVRDGRYKRFFDRSSGRFSNGRKYVLAVLKNDSTLDIARYVREKPGSSQKEVATRFQLSPSSVHWHVERLTEVGLVSKTREAHNVKYFPGEAWDHVTVEDLKALETPIAEAPVASEASPAPGPAPA